MKKKSQPIKLAVAGASGRMGDRIISIAEDDSRFQIMAGIERRGSEFVGRFVGRGHIPIVGSVDEVLPKSDVIIDFTQAGSVVKTAEKVAKAKKKLVIGTTGLKPAQEKRIKALSRRIPIVYAPNMSVGVNLLFKLVEEAARLLRHYDIEIVEAHHNQKKDAPSGTAVKLAEIATRASGRSQKDLVYGRKGMVGARKKKEIGVMSLRAGDIVGDHTVYLANPGERIELVHRAHSRDAFASGAVTAAAWIMKKKSGLYNMHDVLGIK